MPGVNVTPGDVMRRHRAELNLSQAKLAARVGTTARQIRRYENGEVEMPLDVAVAISRALGIRLSELGGSDDG